VAAALGVAAAWTQGPQLARAQQIEADADTRLRVVVAVLPFRVHSAQPLGYLEHSLADLLESRLEASGRVEVVESVVVREALLGYAAGDLTEDALARLAAELSADYVVAGSLTELAGRFSLDVRVNPVGERAASQTLAFTARGEDDLLERMNELADRVLEILAGVETRPRVAEVRVLGAEGLEEDPQEQLQLRAGDPYEAALARADVASLRAMPGVATATVQAERSAEGVIVTYRVVPADRILSPSESLSQADRVAGIEVVGNRRIEASAIRARITTAPGDPYDPGRVAEDVREIYALGFFRNVRVLSEDGARGRTLVSEVEENPVVRQVTLSGNDSIGDDQIRDILTLTTGATLDQPLLYENQNRIGQLYRAQGYYLAEVDHEIEPLPGDAVAVHFMVEEGGKLKLRAIDFEGNEHLSDDELRKGLKTKPWRFWSYVTRFFDKSGTYSEPLFQQDLDLVVQKYQNDGFIQVEVGEPDVDPEPKGLTVSVPIEEGLRFDVGRVDVAGDDTLDLEELRDELLLAQGEVFNRSYLTGDVESLSARYRDRGFYFASVEPQTRVSKEDLTVDVTFEVEKGPLYFVREIDISGNTNTIDPVVRREMQLVEGQLYSARAIRLSQARLQGLGFFEEVNLEPGQTDRPEQLDLDVKVVERPTGSLSFGAGFSSQDGFVVSGSLGQSNLFGRGYAVQLSADIGRTQRYFLSFSDPYFLGSDWSLSATAFRSEVRFEDFDSEQNGIDLTFGRSLDLENRTRGFLRYSWVDRKVDQSGNVNAASVIFREVLSGEESTSLLGLAVRRDKRDDRVLPTAGYQLSSGVEFAGLGGFSKFLRMESRFAWYTTPPEWTPHWFPFRDNSALSFAARGGWAIPFNDIGDYSLPKALDPGSPSEVRPIGKIDTDLELPLTERYFLGGLGNFQLRGFKARSVGPRRAVLKRSGLFGTGDLFTPVGREIVVVPIETEDVVTTQGDFVRRAGRGEDKVETVVIERGLASVCNDVKDGTVNNQGNGNGKCNSLYTKDIDDFDDLKETDVIGGNKFVSLSTEYRFPISETLGLVGILFFDTGNAFGENEDVWEFDLWRFGTGFGGLWFSPFGPLQAFIGFPLDKLEVEDSVVFEFSVGGANSF